MEHSNKGLESLECVAQALLPVLSIAASLAQPRVAVPQEFFRNL